MAAVTSSGIWNHAAQATSPLGGAHAMDDSSSSSDSSTDGATISANDFLTLLVTEMQNQDPTADTDPNEYINQLVNVNSLEQLISINQTLTTAMGSSTSSSSSSQSASGIASAAQSASSASHASTSATAAHAASSHPARPSTAVVSGNLSTSEANPSALRVARALDHPRITR